MPENMLLNPTLNYKLYYLKRLRYATYMDLFPIWLLDKQSYQETIGPIPSQEFDTCESALELASKFMEHVMGNKEVVCNDFIACISQTKKLSTSIFFCVTHTKNAYYAEKNLQQYDLKNNNLKLSIIPNDWLCRTILRPILPYNELFC